MTPRNPRIVTTLPAATEIVCALGLGDSLQAVSHECRYPAVASKLPRVTTTNYDFAGSSSRATDQHVRTTLHSGGSLYRLDDDLLVRIEPTHLIMQQLCEVCAITPDQVQKSIQRLQRPPQLLALNADSLKSIYDDIARVGAFLEAEAEARQLVSRLQAGLKRLRARTASLPIRRVFCVEWLDPLFAAGHWIPEMVALAGGRDVIARAGHRSATTTWAQVARQDPEILVIMPCGFPIEKTLSEIGSLTGLPEWRSLQAVTSRQVWLVSGPDAFSQSGPRLISHGVPLLAKLFHPQVFGRPTADEAVLLH